MPRTHFGRCGDGSDRQVESGPLGSVMNPECSRSGAQAFGRWRQTGRLGRRDHVFTAAAGAKAFCPDPRRWLDRVKFHVDQHAQRILSGSKSTLYALLRSRRRLTERSWHQPWAKVVFSVADALQACDISSIFCGGMTPRPFPHASYT